MSFRNYNIGAEEQIKIEDSNSQLYLTNSFPNNNKNQEVQDEVLRKISNTIVALHENYLQKCSNI